MKSKAMNDKDKKTCCHGDENKNHLHECECNHDEINEEECHHHEEEHACCHHLHEEDHACCHNHHHEKNEEEEHECCHHHGEKEKHHHHHGCSCCSDEEVEEEKNGKVLFLRFLGSILFLLLAIFIPGPFALTVVFYCISYLIIGYDVIYHAIYNLFHGEFFDENFLMTLASFVALLVYIINPHAGIDANDAILVMLLYQIGEYLQDKAVDKSKDSISAMLDLDVHEVCKVVDNTEQIISLDAVKVGDILKIKPGDKIPVDGVVVSGSSSLNTSSLTGESKPLDVVKDDQIFSGALNLNGVFYMKASSTSLDSTTAKVKEMIKNASKNKAKSEKFIRKFAKIYTPVVILISLCIMFIPPLILGFSDYFVTWLYKGLAIMVISCPCALVISVPLSFFSGIGKSAKYGILIKGASYLENLNKVNTIAFDKTGTITKGSFEVIKQEYSDEKLAIDLIYSMEKDSSHPIALTLTKSLEKKATALPFEQIENIPGFGMTALYRGKKVLVGNHKLLENHHISFVKQEAAGTILYVAYDQQCLGYVLISDTLKENAREDLIELKNKYIDEMILITGDNEKVAQDVAEKTAMDCYYAEKLPQDKAEILLQIKKDPKKKVAYVGDGINDVATILNADVGIAMKSLGSDIVLSAADVVLMNDKISQISKSIQISKKTMRIVKENIFFSLLIKITVMVLEIFFPIPMAIAILADVGVCLLAIANSLRIMYGK